MILLDFIVLLLGIILLIPSLMFALEMFVGLSAGGARQKVSSQKDVENRLAAVKVLVPAHNETLNIETLLQNLTAQIDPRQILVIADNCTDDTATLARSYGVEVSERADPEKRGKGFALHHGIEILKSAPPDFLIIMDADCKIFDGGLLALVEKSRVTGKPCQAWYQMHSKSTAGPGQLISEFAWILTNYIRPRALTKLGVPCRLNGTGMIFPWNCLSLVDLNNGHKVEDLVMGLNLSLAGQAASFCDEAVVTSYFPVQNTAETSQRQRWELGTLSVMFEWCPKLLSHFIKKPSISGFLHFADMAILPLTVFVGVLSAYWFIALAVFFVGESLPLIISMIALLLVLGSCMIAYFRTQPIRTGNISLLSLLTFVLLKLQVYNPVSKTNKGWVRTERDNEE